MKNLLKPKNLAIICVILTAITITMDIVYYEDYHIFNISLYTLIDLIFMSSKIIILIYFLIILLKKKKNIKCLNLILLIAYLISSIYWLLSFYMNFIYYDKIDILIYLLIAIENIILFITLIGIYQEKPWSYKNLLIIMLINEGLYFIVQTYLFISPMIFENATIIFTKYITNYIVDYIYEIITTLIPCCIALFLKKYGDSIKERRLINEQQQYR